MDEWSIKRTCRALALACGTVAGAQAQAAELTVRVSGLESQGGHVGCALFSSDAGFPMENSGRPMDWVVVDNQQATCHFKDIVGGAYAVSVVHDRNDNRKLDTNMFGLPTEPWGVSNNVRPRLRAPRFDEARISIDGTRDVGIDVRVAP